MLINNGIIENWKTWKQTWENYVVVARLDSQEALDSNYISNSNCNKLQVVSVYKPPACALQEFKYSTNQSEIFASNKQPVSLLTGDFNFDHAKLALVNLKLF